MWIEDMVEEVRKKMYEVCGEEKDIFKMMIQYDIYNGYDELLVGTKDEKMFKCLIDRQNKVVGCFKEIEIKKKGE